MQKLPTDLNLPKSTDLFNLPSTSFPPDSLPQHLDTVAEPALVTVVSPEIPTQVLQPSAHVAPEPAASCESAFAFMDLDMEDLDQEIILGGTAAKPAVPLLKTGTLKNKYFHFKQGGTDKFFIDKKLPSSATTFDPDDRFDTSYFTTLSTLVAAPGPTWKAGTPNYLGARVKLVHTDLNMNMWRHHLIGYENAEICQFLEYGFPVGLDDPLPVLVPATTNHGSAYAFYKWIDKFLSSGLKKRYIAGPFSEQPFEVIHLSPLMSAEKKPDSRRPVFDATFGDFSLNNGTPSDQYMGQAISFAYPRIEDFRRLVLLSGVGCYMWKRDLSSFFLQIPMDPVDYPKVSFVWRSTLFFFLGLMFGLRHSGYNAQRVTDAVTWIHRRLGLDTEVERPFNSINYSDDIGGCESSEERATQSSFALSDLLEALGLKESHDKYHPPSTSMPYLGVQFDSVKQLMSVPPEKLSEVREEVEKWSRKSTATKKTLQQLLGKLFWVSRCVRYSRPFMGRLLQQLKTMHLLPDNKKAILSPDCKLDISWWCRYLRKFNGVELMYTDEPLGLSLPQLLETQAKVNCGDAQIWGGGAYYGGEYWSRPFPPWLQDPCVGIHLKEFYVVLASCWLWGDMWTGSMVYIFCDNEAVVETLDKEKPKDPSMQDLLREFLYIVCTKKFTPIFRKIGTKENFVADFISRCHDQVATSEFFTRNDLPARKFVEIPDNLFNLNSNW